MPSPDFVFVQLTPAGIALAEGFTLRVNQGRRAFAFEPGTPLRVERSFEWRAILSNQLTPAGEPLFELAPTPPASAAPATQETT